MALNIRNLRESYLVPLLYINLCARFFLFFVNDEKLYRNDFDFCYLYISFHEKFYSSFIFKRSIIV